MDNFINLFLEIGLRINNPPYLSVQREYLLCSPIPQIQEIVPDCAVAEFCDRR